MKTYLKPGILFLVLSVMTLTFSGCLLFDDDDDDKEVVVVDGN